MTDKAREHFVSSVENNQKTRDEVDKFPHFPGDVYMDSGDGKIYVWCNRWVESTELDKTVFNVKCEEK